LPVQRLRRERVTIVATKVFGTPQKAEAWLRAPNEALGGAVPFSLLDELDDFQRVIDELESLAEERGGG
jgi:uncharacterized protein (DUF2384 family)